jgi:hypothetical protein
MDSQETISNETGNPKFTPAWILTSVKISPELHNKARIHHILISEASRVGISMMLADIGEMDYDNNLPLIKKIELLRQKLEATSKELDFLKNEKLKILDKESEEFFEKIETLEPEIKKNNGN